MTAYVYTSGGFPSSPVSGDTLAINSAQYQWDGTTWVANTAPSGPTGATGAAGAAGPASLSFGEFSIEPVTGMLSVNYYGAAYEEDFSINSNGELEVTT